MASSKPYDVSRGDPQALHACSKPIQNAPNSLLIMDSCGGQLPGPSQVPLDWQNIVTSGTDFIQEQFGFPSTQGIWFSGISSSAYLFRLRGSSYNFYRSSKLGQCTEQQVTKLISNPNASPSAGAPSGISSIKSMVTAAENHVQDFGLASLAQSGVELDSGKGKKTYVLNSVSPHSIDSRSARALIHSSAIPPPLQQQSNGVGSGNSESLGHSNGDVNLNPEKVKPGLELLMGFLAKK